MNKLSSRQKSSIGIRKSGPLRGKLKKGYRFNGNGRVVKAKKSRMGVNIDSRYRNPKMSELSKSIPLKERIKKKIKTPKITSCKKKNPWNKNDELIYRLASRSLW